MDPTQQAASQIIKGGTVTALTVSIKICLRDNKFSQLFTNAREVS